MSHRATLADISQDRWFLSRARQQRQFVLAEDTPTAVGEAIVNAVTHRDTRAMPASR